MEPWKPKDVTKRLGASAGTFRRVDTKAAAAKDVTELTRANSRKADNSGTDITAEIRANATGAKNDVTALVRHHSKKANSGVDVTDAMLKYASKFPEVDEWGAAMEESDDPHHTLTVSLRASELKHLSDIIALHAISPTLIDELVKAGRGVGSGPNGTNGPSVPTDHNSNAALSAAVGQAVAGIAAGFKAPGLPGTQGPQFGSLGSAGGDDKDIEITAIGSPDGALVQLSIPLGSGSSSGSRRTEGLSFGLTLVDSVTKDIPTPQDPTRPEPPDRRWQFGEIVTPTTDNRDVVDFVDDVIGGYDAAHPEVANAPQNIFDTAQPVEHSEAPSPPVGNGAGGNGNDGTDNTTPTPPDPNPGTGTGASDRDDGNKPQHDTSGFYGGPSLSVVQPKPEDPSGEAGAVNRSSNSLLLIPEQKTNLGASGNNDPSGDQLLRSGKDSAFVGQLRGAVDPSDEVTRPSVGGGFAPGVNPAAVREGRQGARNSALSALLAAINRAGANRVR